MREAYTTWDKGCGKISIPYTLSAENSVSKLWGNFLGQGVKVWASHLCLWQAGSCAWPGPWLSLCSLCLMTRPAATWHQALPNSLNRLKSHFCAEKGKKAHEGGTGGGWYCGPAEILGEKRDWPLYQTWLQLVIRRKESFFVQLTHSEAWVGPVYRRPVSDDTLMLGEERRGGAWDHKSSLMNCARPGPGSPLPGPAICWQIWAN